MREAGPRPALEEEPDYRFSLANERTLLAYLRTAMALMAAGLVLLQITSHGATRYLGDALVVTGVAVSWLSYHRWRTVQRALRRGAPLPRPVLPLLVATVLTAAAVVLLATWP